jgi:hypothetical protein
MATNGFQELQNQSLAASASINFNPIAANVFDMITVGGSAGAAGSLSILVNDGTTGRQVQTIAAAGNGVSSIIVVTQNNKLRLVNSDAVNAATYALSIIQWN